MNQFTIQEELNLHKQYQQFHHQQFEKKRIERQRAFEATEKKLRDHHNACQAIRNRQFAQNTLLPRIVEQEANQNQVSKMQMVQFVYFLYQLFISLHSMFGDDILG